MYFNVLMYNSCMYNTKTSQLLPEVGLPEDFKGTGKN